MRVLLNFSISLMCPCYQWISAFPTPGLHRQWGALQWYAHTVWSLVFIIIDAGFADALRIPSLIQTVTMGSRKVVGPQISQPCSEIAPLCDEPQLLLLPRACRPYPSDFRQRSRS